MREHKISYIKNAMIVFVIVVVAVMGLRVNAVNAADYATNGNVLTYNGNNYSMIEVDGGELSGTRRANVAVDIGYGDRVYWGLTNEYGQLVYVLADSITIQDSATEPVNASGRYYDDEAAVPGTEREDLDQGHVIADSLGGVSNAYNITPQDSTLNRHGDQAYMESVIRKANGCTDFVATITYPDTETQIPSHYHYEYIVAGNRVVDDFDNVNPEADVETKAQTAATSESSNNSAQEENIVQKDSSAQEDNSVKEDTNAQQDISAIDTNHNGIVTIAEAKAAGFKMPIKSTHWLYQYMKDGDGDGMVGE